MRIDSAHMMGSCREWLKPDVQLVAKPANLSKIHPTSWCCSHALNAPTHGPRVVALRACEQHHELLPQHEHPLVSLPSYLPSPISTPLPLHSHSVSFSSSFPHAPLTPRCTLSWERRGQKSTTGPDANWERSVLLLAMSVLVWSVSVQVAVSVCLHPRLS